MDIENYIKSASNGATPIFDDYKFQLELWNEMAFEPTDKFVTIRSIGGPNGREWNRFPNYEVFITSITNRGLSSVNEDASSLVEYIRSNAKSECHTFIQSLEPQFNGQTENNRYVYRVVLSSVSKG